MSAERLPLAGVLPAHPTYHELPRLQRRTSRSFAAESPEAIEAYLTMAHGLILQPGRAPAERSRLLSPRFTEDGRVRSLAVLYHSGSLLIQGPSALALAEHLGEFCEPDQSETTLFDGFTADEQVGARVVR